jgi:hypothetical protein
MQALRERHRKRQVRRIVFTSAVAASLLLAALSAYQGMRPDHLAGRLDREQEQTSSRPEPFLQQTVEDAGSAMVALTRLAADETLGQARFFLPVALPSPHAADPKEIGHVLEPSTNSLHEVRESVSASLEPVTESARRAVDLFWREVPTLHAD